jgi:hypothetical protein
MPFFLHDGNGECCWCHKGKATHTAWDWMVCHKCFMELEAEEGVRKSKKRDRREIRRQKQDAVP